MLQVGSVGREHLDNPCQGFLVGWKGECLAELFRVDFVGDFPPIGADAFRYTFGQDVAADGFD